MEEYISLDVSMKETAVAIRRSGVRVWRGKCASDPRVIAEMIRKRVPMVKRVVFETGPLSVWFHHALRAEGLSYCTSFHLRSPRLLSPAFVRALCANAASLGATGLPEL